MVIFKLTNQRHPHSIKISISTFLTQISEHFSNFWFYASLWLVIVIRLRTHFLAIISILRHRINRLSILFNFTSKFKNHSRIFTHPVHKSIVGEKALSTSYLVTLRFRIAFGYRSMCFYVHFEKPLLYTATVFGKVLNEKIKHGYNTLGREGCGYIYI